MKLILVAATCFFVSGATYAQNATQHAGHARVRKTAIGGTINDKKGHPVPKVQAYIYKGDSATNSSGYTDANGNFETNNVMPGTYDLRLVYPSAKRIVINGVPVKMHRVTYINLATTEPTADSAISYSDIAPKAAK